MVKSNRGRITYRLRNIELENHHFRQCVVMVDP